MPAIPEFISGQSMEKELVMIEFPEGIKKQFNKENVWGNYGSKIVSKLTVESDEDFSSFVDRARGNDGSIVAFELTLQSYKNLLDFINKEDCNAYITENSLWLFIKPDEIDFPKLEIKEDNS